MIVPPYSARKVSLAAEASPQETKNTSWSQAEKNWHTIQIKYEIEITIIYLGPKQWCIGHSALAS